MLRYIPTTSFKDLGNPAEQEPVGMQPRRCLNCGNPITDDTRQYQLFCSSFCRYEIEEKHAR